MKSMFIIHFASRAQVDLLRQVFVRAEVKVFSWPMAGGQELEERVVWEVPDWLDVMDQFATFHVQMKAEDVARAVNGLPPKELV